MATTYTADSPEVKAEMEKYNISADVAIGNLLTRDKLTSSGQTPAQPTPYTATDMNTNVAPNPVGQPTPYALNSPASRVRSRNIAKEKQVANDALKEMGWDGKTPKSQFLSDPAKADLYREKVNMFTYGVANPIFKEETQVDKAAASVESANTKLAEINDQIKSMINIPAPDLGMTPAETQMMDLLKGQMDAMKAYNDQLIASIKARTQQQIEAQKIQNKIDMGKSAWQLAKMGALGTTMSGHDYLLQVQAAGEAKIADLVQQGNEALIEANKAIADNNFRLATQMIDFALDVDKRIRDEKQRYFENTLAAQEELRRQQEFNRKMVDWAQEDINNLVSLGFSKDDFSESDKREYEAAAGYPAGTFDKLIELAEAQQYADSYEKELELAKKKYDILKNIPEDQEIVIAGQVESGLRPVKANKYEKLVTDANGNIKVVVYDEDTGEVEVHDTGIRTAVKTKVVRSSGGSRSTSVPSSGYGTSFNSALPATDLRDLTLLMSSKVGKVFDTAKEMSFGMSTVNAQLNKLAGQLMEKDMQVASIDYTNPQVVNSYLNQAYDLMYNNVYSPEYNPFAKWKEPKQEKTGIKFTKQIYDDDDYKIGTVVYDNITPEDLQNLLGE